MADLYDSPPGLILGLENSSTSLKVTVAVFLTIALFNSLELIVLVCWMFRQWQGLYFWSLLISSVGLIPYTVGSILHFFNVGPLAVGLTISYVGYIAIVPTQSFVVYSRLYLVFYNEKVLKYLLIIMILVSILLVIPTSVATFGSAFVETPTWNYAYNVIERLQVTGFCVQELGISFLYIRSTLKLLHLSPEGKNRLRRLLYELLAISFIIILLDVAIMVIQYLNLYYLQVCLKSLVYSIKLKLELAVLSRLVAITKSRQFKQQGRVMRSEFIGPSYDLSDFDNAATTSEERQASSGSRGLEQSNLPRYLGSHAVLLKLGHLIALHNAERLVELYHVRRRFITIFLPL
ncbi:hypothetical protein BDW59DRAFT_181929 [Aspergillus cavernicola]|uniref:DUF7703 domain-containing protein n=1 Tax=Aspergillus cavernicola TaxID=176166 RepID=A0ABR4HS52_9EURO